MPLGKRVNWARDEKGVKVGWELNPAWKRLDADGKVTMSFQELWGAVEGKFYDGFSIGYIPTKTEPIKLEDGRPARKLKNVSILTTALTGTPMNPEANMTMAFAKSLAFVKSNSQLGDTMTDDENKKTEDKTDDVKKTADVKSDEETKDNLIEFKSKIETLEKEATEVKSELVEVKSLNTELKTKVEGLEKDKAELKSIVETAQQKAISQSEVDLKKAEAKAQPEEKSVGNVLGYL